MASRQSVRTPARRRQRSVRVTVAVALLSVATVAVLAALPTQSPVFLSIAAVVSLLLGWSALRIVWTEVLQSRRENSLDRAAAATAYKELFSVRAAEHAEFTSAMTERLAAANLSHRELEGALVQSQRSAAQLTVRAESAETALGDAISRVAELQELIAARELADAEAVAAWEAEGGDTSAETLADLVEWAEKTAEAAAEKTAQKQPAETA